MKSLLVLLSISFSMSAMAFQTGMGPNGPWTRGPLGYTDPFYTSAWTAQAVVGTTILPTATGVLTTASAQLKQVAQAIQADAQNYLQTGEMSPILGYQVNNILGQNNDLSTEEAVSIVLEFAEIHAAN